MEKEYKKENVVTVVVSSRKKSEEHQDFITKLHESFYNEGDEEEYYGNILFVTNDGAMSLTRLYASILKNTEIIGDIVVFCHDDIEFLRKGWIKELCRIFKENEEYGIIGVAGSAEFDSKAMWWTYKNKYGQVVHRQNGRSWLSAFSPLLNKDLEEVCVIDGLFIALNKKRITKNFDMDLDGFDFYDIDFCLANYLDGKTKIGVTTNIRIAHNSIGQLRDSWKTNRDVINKKYGKYYPIKLKK